MATNTSAELDAFDCNLGETGLDEFEPEPARGVSWLRVADPRESDTSASDIQNRRPYVAPRHERTWPLVIPVLVAASLVGAAVTWVSLRSGAVAVSSPAPARSAVAPAAPVEPPAAVPVPEPLPKSIETPPPAVGAQAVPDAAVEPTPTLDPAVERTLTRIRDAYRALDAASLAAVWPAADTSALAESFSALKYQALTFDRCRVQPNGSDSVLVACDVSIATASKAGDPGLQRRRESWTLVLSRAGDQWTIAGVTVR